MRSLALGAVLLVASVGTAAACVQGDRDCENMMNLDKQSHRRLLLPGPPDENRQKYDAARQEFGRRHAAETATAEQQAWEKKRKPDRPPEIGTGPGADKGSGAGKAGQGQAEAGETPAARTAKTVFAFDRDRKPGRTIYLFGHGQPSGSGAVEGGKGAPRQSPAE